jgi:hypothetical protein
MKRFFAIILLAGVFVMNTGILCESLCLTDSHMSHHTMSHAKPESSKAQACPISKTHNHSSNTEPEAFIKCDCSSDLKSSLSEVPLFSEIALNLTPQTYLISNLSPYKSSFINVEHSPLEKPPQILA